MTLRRLCQASRRTAQRVSAFTVAAAAARATPSIAPLTPAAEIHTFAMAAAASSTPTAGEHDAPKREEHVQLQRAFKVDTAAGSSPSSTLHWAVATTQGRRPEQEDAHLARADLDGRGTAVFGVFDGHAGKEVAAFCAKHLPDVLIASEAWQQGDIAAALSDAYFRLDELMADKSHQAELYCLRKGLPTTQTPEGAGGTADEIGIAEPAFHRLAPATAHHVSSRAAKYGRFDEHGRYQGPRAGSTATVAVIQGRELYVANAGDSRIVLAEASRAIPLTHDHKPTDAGEARRIYRAGDFVARGRVRGSLAMSRCLGDAKYKDAEGLRPEKQAVTAEPDVQAVSVQPPAVSSSSSRRPADNFLILACDGLWDVMSNQDAVAFCHEALVARGMCPTDTLIALLDEALAVNSATPPSFDNITVMLVLL